MELRGYGTVTEAPWRKIFITPVLKSARVRRTPLTYDQSERNGILRAKTCRARPHKCSNLLILSRRYLPNYTILGAIEIKHRSICVSKNHESLGPHLTMQYVYWPGTYPVSNEGSPSASAK